MPGPSATPSMCRPTFRFWHFLCPNISGTLLADHRHGTNPTQDGRNSHEQHVAACRRSVGFERCCIARCRTEVRAPVASWSETAARWAQLACFAAHAIVVSATEASRVQEARIAKSRWCWEQMSSRRTRLRVPTFWSRTLRPIPRCNEVRL